MFLVRLLATALFACAIAVPAFAQEPAPTETGRYGRGDGAGRIDDRTASGLTGVNAVPQLPRVTPDPDGNPFKLIAGDFKNFFSARHRAAP